MVLVIQVLLRSGLCMSLCDPSLELLRLMFSTPSNKAFERAGTLVCFRAVVFLGVVGRGSYLTSYFV